MKTLQIFMLTILFAVGSVTMQTRWIPPAHAAGGHEHDEHGDDHKDDDAHKHEHEEESHDDHEGHGDEHGEEDGHGHGHGHGEHEEGRTKIDPDAANAAGVKISKAGPATIQEVLTLTGRIMLNRNTTAEVRARFPGVVQNVKVNWGDKVKKGQPLATIEANESLRVYTVNAPIDGVVLTRNTNIGNVAGEEALFTVADLSEVWAEFHVFPRDLSKVKEKQQVRVHTLENGKEIEAPITLILPTADPLSQTVIAVVSIPNKDGKWRPGMTVEGDVHISEKHVALAVTEDAVQRMEDKTVVFVKEGETYEKRAVKLGNGDGKYIEVREGIKAGEQYVSQGSFIVKADIGKGEAGHDHAH
ncbi:MAG: efflux RND transporter periplasmic adaptor subunit [Rickettsiales bacterium]|nr:efflux RND transporter periplasmic adaptor subunit [Rickettsiales bacterium]